MDPRRQKEVLYFCYAVAVVWFATVAPASAAPRPSPAEQHSDEGDAPGIRDVENIAYQPDDEAYYDYEDGQTYNVTQADVQSDYYAWTAAELMTALPSYQPPGDRPSSYTDDYEEDDEMSSDEAAAVEDDDRSNSGDVLEGRYPNRCKDVAAVDGVRDEECKDVETEPYGAEGVAEPLEDYPYNY